jgi:PAS domain S-box-containing protein
MIIVELIFNLSLLVAVSVISGFIVSRWKRTSWPGIVAQGILFGTVALIGMLNPFELVPGIIFDGRSVVISLCTLFFGPVAGLIASLFALAYRFYLGGGGVVTGVSVILESYLIGYAFYLIKRKRQKPLRTPELYLLGLLVHIAMVGLLAAMPIVIRTTAFKTMSVTILVIYPLATVLIGKILKDQEDNANLINDLAANERRFRLLVNNMNQGLAEHKIICNSDGKPIDYIFEYVNEKYEEITGLRKEEILGRSILEVMPKTSERTIQKYGEVALSGKPFHFESYSRSRKIYFEAYIYQPSDEHFAVIVSDITERKQAQKEAFEKNKQFEKLIVEKDKLFSIVSHDLRSPINGILGLTGLIVEETESFSKDHIREIAKSIHTSAGSITQLLQGLLEWSQLQRGNITFDPQPEMLLNSVKKCTNVLQESARAKNITLHTQVPDNIKVFADRQMLETVIRNLITNAIKFTPKGGRITMNCSEQEPGIITVSISDDGIGMPAQILEKIFSLSTKINRKGTEGELSSGLGLIMCKELIEKNGGKIWAESKESKGSVFYFTLKKYTDGNETI